MGNYYFCSRSHCSSQKKRKSKKAGEHCLHLYSEGPKRKRSVEWNHWWSEDNKSREDAICGKTFCFSYMVICCISNMCCHAEKSQIARKAQKKAVIGWDCYESPKKTVINWKLIGMPKNLSCNSRPTEVNSILILIFVFGGDIFFFVIEIPFVLHCYNLWKHLNSFDFYFSMLHLLSKCILIDIFSCSSIAFIVFKFKICFCKLCKELCTHACTYCSISPHWFLLHFSFYILYLSIIFTFLVILAICLLTEQPELLYLSIFLR